MAAVDDLRAPIRAGQAGQQSFVHPRPGARLSSGGEGNPRGGTGAVASAGGGAVLSEGVQRPPVAVDQDGAEG